MSNPETVAKKPAKKQARPIFLIVRKLVDPRTGEEVGCLVPSNEGAREEMKRRKYTQGKRLKAELSVPRNYEFWKKAHVLARLCMKHVDAFDGKGEHEALKKLQTDARIECDVFRFTVLDQVVQYRVPRTLAFDSMPEDVFTTVYETIVEHIKDRYFPEWSDEQMQELIDLTDREQNWQ
jgi:hypothetical protein